jgi:BolA protein
MKIETTATRIHHKLTETFSPIVLEVRDESTRHSGHAGSRAEGETHFHIKIVSYAFAGMNKVARHRAVYAALADDMQEGGIHALALEVLAVGEA